MHWFDSSDQYDYWHLPGNSILKQNTLLLVGICETIRLHVHRKRFVENDSKIENIFPRKCLDSCQRKPLTFASAEFRHSMPSFIVPLTMSSFLVPAFVRWRSFVESIRDAHSPGFCAAEYFSGTTFVYKSTEFVHAMEFHFSKCSFNLGHSLFVFFSFAFALWMGHFVSYSPCYSK